MADTLVCLNSTQPRMDATTSAASDIPALSPSPGIARIWHGRTPLALADAGVRKIAAIPGNRGVRMVMRKTSQEGEFLVVSYWDAIEAVERFAGPAYE